jgi:hypothetical protein
MKREDSETVVSVVINLVSVVDKLGAVRKASYFQQTS